MRGRASRGWWWGAALLGACQPLSGGVGTGGANTLGLPDDTDETTADATEAEPSSMGEADTTESPNTGADPSGSPEGTTTGPADETTTDEPPPATTGMGEPSLVISDGPTYDFGNVPINNQLSHVFTVTNEGDGDATGLDGVVAAPFGFPGAFPGGAGSCGSGLDVGQSCTVEVTFAPGAQIGLHTGMLAVDHDGGPAATRELRGGAAGQSDNLIANPGGESFGEPPPAWTPTLGIWGAGYWLEEGSTAAGNGYLYSDAGGNNVDLSLRQTIDASAWASTIDAGALQVSFSGQARAYQTNNDEHRIRVHYHDAGGAILATWTSNYASQVTWQSYANMQSAPVGTRTVEIELNCRKSYGDVCHAYFDALDLRASYP